MISLPLVAMDFGDLLLCSVLLVTVALTLGCYKLCSAFMLTHFGGSTAVKEKISHGELHRMLEAERSKSLQLEATIQDLRRENMNLLLKGQCDKVSCTCGKSNDQQTVDGRQKDGNAPYPRVYVAQNGKCWHLDRTCYHISKRNGVKGLEPCTCCVPMRLG